MRLIDWIKENLWIVIIGFFIFLGLCFGIFAIVLLIMYGDKPIDEIPTWVIWIIFPRRK